MHEVQGAEHVADVEQSCRNQTATDALERYPEVDVIVLVCFHQLAVVEPFRLVELIKDGEAIDDLELLDHLLAYLVADPGVPGVDYVLKFCVVVYLHSADFESVYPDVD